MIHSIYFNIEKIRYLLAKRREIGSTRPQYNVGVYIFRMGFRNSMSLSLIANAKWGRDVSEI